MKIAKEEGVVKTTIQSCFKKAGLVETEDDCDEAHHKIAPNQGEI